MSDVRSNISNRLHGSYQAKVVDVSHPEGLYLARIRLLHVWDSIKDSDCPWAEFLLPIGAKASAGEVVPVEVGNYVWVDFPRMGDTRYPRITGSLYYAPNKVSNLPDEVNGTAYEPKRGEGEPNPPAYDRKDFLYDRFGLREHRTSQGGYSITHKGTGTALEITPSGQWVLHVEGDGFESLTGNKTEQVGKDLKITIKGKTTIESKGAVSVKTDAGVVVDAGGDISFKTGGKFAVDAGGAFEVKATNAAWRLG